VSGGDVVGLVFRHFWLAFVVVTVVNGQAWWRQIQGRIREAPELAPGYRRLYRGYLFWANVPWLLMGAGVLSGRVGGVHDFLQPRAGNPVVVGWWAALAMLLALGTWWIMLGGGAETLERHPGVPMIPQWSARNLKWYWLAVVGWNVVVGAFLVFGVSKGPGRSAPLEPLSSWMPFLFPVFFVAMWVGVGYLLAGIGGWHALARHYAAADAVDGTRFRFRSARVGSVNYGSCVSFVTSLRGLHISTLPLFRAGHRPLFVPWADVSARPARQWLAAAVELRFARVPTVSVRVSRRLGEALVRESGGHVTLPAAT
jgi:hypothetical protein